MIINAVRYRSVNGGDDFQIWRFSQGTGKYQSFYCFFETPNRLEEMISALNFALTGKPSANIKEVAIHLSDDSGDTWVVERAPNKLRALRNSKLLDNKNVEHLLLNAMFDEQIPVAMLTERGSRLINRFDLVLENNQIIAKPASDDAAGFGKVKILAVAQEKLLLEKASGLLEQPLLLEKTRLLELAQKIEPLHSEFCEINRQKRSMLTSNSNLENFDSTTIERLQREVEILDELETIARPLLAPGVSPKILKDKLIKVEEELVKGLSRCHLKSLPITNQSFAWHKLATALTKVEAYERLVKASEKACQVGQENIAPTYEQYISTIEKLISSDSQITAELESCLSSLHLHLGSTQEDAAKKQSFGKMISDFIQPKISAEELAAQEEKNKGILENSRMAVDYALGRLGELHLNLNHIKQDFESWRNQLQEAHEHVVQEYGKLRGHWETLAKEHNLDVSMTLPDLLQLMAQYSQLVELRAKRARYRTLLAERKNQLHRLEELILEWSQISGSQKTTDMPTPTILIAQAQGILRYKDKKNEQLTKLEELASIGRAYHTLKTNIEGRQITLQARWRRAFEEVSVPMIPSDNPHWPLVFKLVTTLDVWSSVVKENAKPINGPRIFAIEETPVTLFQWVEQNLTNTNRLELLGLIENYASDRPQLLFVSDAPLANMLVKLGLGRVTKVNKQLPQNPAVSESGSISPREQRIQNAMSILKGKRTNQEL